MASLRRSRSRSIEISPVNLETRRGFITLHLGHIYLLLADIDWFPRVQFTITYARVGFMRVIANLERTFGYKRQISSA